MALKQIGSRDEQNKNTEISWRDVRVDILLSIDPAMCAAIPSNFKPCSMRH